jgi:hypothetical protein
MSIHNGHIGEAVAHSFPALKMFLANLPGVGYFVAISHIEVRGWAEALVPISVVAINFLIIAYWIKKLRGKTND